MVPPRGGAGEQGAGVGSLPAANTRQEEQGLLRNAILDSFLISCSPKTGCRESKGARVRGLGEPHPLTSVHLRGGGQEQTGADSFGQSYRKQTEVRDHQPLGNQATTYTHAQLWPASTQCFSTNSNLITHASSIIYSHCFYSEPK